MLPLMGPVCILLLRSSGLQTKHYWRVRQAEREEMVLASSALTHLPWLFLLSFSVGFFQTAPGACLQLGDPVSFCRSFHLSVYKVVSATC